MIGLKVETKKIIMTEEYKNEVIEILENLGNQLDISESQYNEAVKSYEAVGDWLSKEGSPLYPYKHNNQTHQ